MKRACDFERPKVTTPPTTTTTATTAYRKAKLEVKAKDEVEAFKTEEADRVLVEPVAVEAAYPNLVSTYLLKCNKYRQNEPVQIEK